jgi:hypothetical protein
LTASGEVVIIDLIPNCRTNRMNTPSPSQPSRPQPALPGEVDVSKVRKWLELKHEMAELHAKLEYLKLMMSLGVSP